MRVVSVMSHDVTSTHSFRKVVVIGRDGFEVTGIAHMLHQAGVRVCRGCNMTSGPGDLLVVAVSSTTLLGWWRNIAMLQTLRNAGAYQMVAVVPPYMVDVVSRLQICHCINGKGGLERVRATLLNVVRDWEFSNKATVARRKCGHNPRYNTCYISHRRLCSMENVLTEHDVRLTKSQYSNRYHALSLLGFDSVTLFRVVAAGWNTQFLSMKKYLFSVWQCRWGG